MNAGLDIEVEQAIRLLVEHLPPSAGDSRKPILAHDIRVGVCLYQQGYSRNIVLAGFLHDAIEWSDVTPELLAERFGKEVTTVVLANSKDRSIADPTARIDDMMQRCAAVGQDALIVKAADTIDSFEYYSKTGNQEELAGHCVPNADALLAHLPEGCSNPIFYTLRDWRVKTKTD